MAMPTSACASAGASLMPSPAIATRAPLGLQALDHRRLLLGQHVGFDVVDADGARHGLGGVRLSPVSITTRSPSACSALIASAVVALIGSATPTSPAATPSTATNITVSPLRRSVVGARRQRPAVDAELVEQRGVADRRPCGRRRRRRRPCPVTDRKSATATSRDAASLRAADDRRRERMLAAPARGSRPGAAARLVDAGLRRRPSSAPACLRSSVPVLSTTSVSTCSSTSSASALRISTPSFGAAAGADHDRHRRRQAERARAGDDQHRDRVHERVGQPRLRAPDRPRRRTSATATSDHRRHEPAGRRCRPAAGSARGDRCASPTIRTICASSVSLPTRSRLHHERCRCR